MSKHVLFSDLHFGDPHCSLSHKKVITALRDFLRRESPLSTVALIGDILDVNIASFSEAIYGVPATKQIGFKKWLEFLFADGKIKFDKLIYVPGNHDYKVWDLLATEKHFIKPIAAGQDFRKGGNLKLRDFFDNPFLRGIVPPTIRKKFFVQYPDIEFKVNGKMVLATHGHYLDEKQTLGKGIRDVIKLEKGDVKEAQRQFFQRAAQYQAAANAVSFREEIRKKVDKTHKNVSKIFDLLNTKSSMRGNVIDNRQLKAMEEYLLYYAEKHPDVFIYGHTHEPGYAETANPPEGNYKRLMPNRNVKVWNTGSFIQKRKRGGSFVLIDDADRGKEIKLVTVKIDGKVKTTMQGGVQ